MDAAVFRVPLGCLFGDPVGKELTGELTSADGVGRTDASIAAVHPSQKKPPLLSFFHTI